MQTCVTWSAGGCLGPGLAITECGVDHPLIAWLIDHLSIKHFVLENFIIFLTSFVLSGASFSSCDSQSFQSRTDFSAGRADCHQYK